VNEINANNKKIKKRKNRLNDLTGAEWVQFSKSVWRFKQPVRNNYGHPAIFPDFVAKRLIRMFTKKGDFVFDPMVGIGTTVVVSRNLDRNALGIELSEKWADIAKGRLEERSKPIETWFDSSETAITSNYHKIICGDARNLLSHVEKESVDFCLTSPPYWIGLHGINGKYTGQTEKEWKIYTEDSRDLGNIKNYDEFIFELKNVYELVFEVLQNGKYFVVIVQDSRRGSEVYTIHIDMIQICKEIGFEYQDMIIWEHPHYTTRPLGYPTTMVISRVHDFILAFRKPKK
jgi:DNA modification methylase